MKKYIILMLLLCSCTPDFEIPEIEPLPTYAPNITPEPTPTLSAEAQVFQDTIDYYEKQVLGCLEIEAGEYLGGDTAGQLLESLREDQALFKNADFVKVFTWLMDDVSVYCTHTAVEDPPMALEILNKVFENSDAEYYQFQRQGRIGIEERNMELIESAFAHRENAHQAMLEASYFYEDLFEVY